MMPVVILARDHLTGDALARVIADIAETTIVSGAACVELPRLDHRVGAVVVDHKIADVPALSLLRALSASYRDTPIIVIGVPNIKRVLLEYIEAGAVGFVTEDDSPSRLPGIILEAQRGEATLDGELVAILIERLEELTTIVSNAALATPVDNPQLTMREMEILDLVGDGLTNAEIADRLYIEVGTVKNHMHSIYKKLETSNRAQVVQYLAMTRMQREDDNRLRSLLLSLQR
jgi:DNA-binding NarL/FixJ family response regulator